MTLVVIIDYICYMINSVKTTYNYFNYKSIFLILPIFENLTFYDFIT